MIRIRVYNYYFAVFYFNTPQHHQPTRTYTNCDFVLLKILTDELMILNNTRTERTGVEVAVIIQCPINTKSIGTVMSNEQKILNNSTSTRHC